MRTSGATTESQMTLAVCLVALGILVLLAGGPAQFMIEIERVVVSIAETAHAVLFRVGS